VIGMRVGRVDGYDERPLEDRVIAFRRSLVSFVVMTPMFLIMNIASHANFPWFFIPSGFMLLDALRKGGSIWSDGVGPFEAFSKGIRAKLRAAVNHSPVGAHRRRSFSARSARLTSSRRSLPPRMFWPAHTARSYGARRRIAR